MTIRLPDSTKRLIVIGRTGSGKSQLSLDILSVMNWDTQPWVIIDYKGEDLIRDIMRQNKGAIREIKVTDNPPKRPGLYYMHPIPKVTDAAMEAFLWKCHSQGNVGLFIDEGFMLPNEDAFDAILTQGRTLHIPVICLYQRPVWMSRFAIAQSDFICVLKQHDLRDEKLTLNFCPPFTNNEGKRFDVTTLKALPPYYSLWHDVGEGRTSLLQPAAGRSEILERYRKRLTPKQHRSFV